jgi:hypothetical protein
MPWNAPETIGGGGTLDTFRNTVWSAISGTKDGPETPLLREPFPLVSRKFGHDPVPRHCQFPDSRMSASGPRHFEQLFWPDREIVRRTASSQDMPGMRGVVNPGRNQRLLNVDANHFAQYEPG